MFRAVPLPIIRSSLAGHLALVYAIRFEVGLRANRMAYTSAKCTANELLMIVKGTARNTYRFIF